MERPLEAEGPAPAAAAEAALSPVVREGSVGRAEPHLLPREPVDSRGQARAPAPAPGEETAACPLLLEPADPRVQVR